MSAVDKKKNNSLFMNGIPLLLVLKLLSRREMYGYEVVRAIRENTNAELDFAEGCIYPVLHGLEREGLVTTREQESAGRKRLYYSLTPAGSDRLTELTDEWARVNRSVGLILDWGRTC